MSNTFKAILLNQSGDNFTREVKILDKNFLKTGEVLIKIDYSNLNFKDSCMMINSVVSTVVFKYIFYNNLFYSFRFIFYSLKMRNK